MELRDGGDSLRPLQTTGDHEESRTSCESCTVNECIIKNVNNV